MNNTVTRQVLGKIMITSKGEYNSLESYEILDAVTYQGSSYLSKKYNNDSLPTNTNDWQLLAQKGDTYELSEEDLQRIAEQITSNANSAFNQNVKEKTDSFNSNATEKLGAYNSNHTAKLKEYNDNATSKLSAYNTNTVTKTTEYNSNHTSKINAYNTNASNKVDIYNTNADTRLEEYNTNADNKIAEYDEHSKELNNKIVSTRNELERLKSNVLNTGEDTDTFIHLEDSAMAELQEIKVDGVCEQNTTTGKNLLDYISNLLTPSNGLTSTLNEDGSITTTGKPIANYSAITKSTNITNVLEDEQTYTISRESTNNKIYIQIMAKKATDGTLTYINNISGSNSFKVDKTTYANYNIVIQTNTIDVWGDASLTITNKYMLYKRTDTTDTSFEPYTGGQPSPNPDYPQEIKTITDSLKVTSCWKNLVERMVLGELNTKTGIFEQSSTVICNERYIPYDGLKKYYIKVDNAPSTANIRWYNQKFEYIGYGITQSSGMIDKSVNTELTSSIPSDTTPKYFKIRKPNVTLLNSTWCVSTDPNYFGEYIESQVQAKLPENEFIGYTNRTNYDVLSTKYNSNAAVYQLVLNKCIAKITIDGTKGSFSMPSAGRFNIDNIINDYLKTSQSYGITTKCDNYISFPQTLSNSDFDSLTSGYNYGIGLGGGTANNIRIKNVNFSNVEDFKNDLKQHPITLYYILNIESRRTLDLGVIDMPMSYKDITNIFTDSDLLPTINAKYYRVFDKTIQNAQINEKTLKQEITDLNATVSALDTRLKALETKPVEEPTESEGTV